MTLLWHVDPNLGICANLSGAYLKMLAVTIKLNLVFLLTKKIGDIVKCSSKIKDKTLGLTSCFDQQNVAGWTKSLFNASNWGCHNKIVHLNHFKWENDEKCIQMWGFHPKNEVLTHQNWGNWPSQFGIWMVTYDIKLKWIEHVRPNPNVTPCPRSVVLEPTGSDLNHGSATPSEQYAALSI